MSTAGAAGADHALDTHGVRDGEERTAAEMVTTWGGLVALVREDLATHKSDWHMPGFQALAVHRLGAWSRGQPRTPRRWLVNRLLRVLSRRVRVRYAIELPATARIGRRLRIPHSGPVVLHPFSRLGDDCLLRQSTTLGTGGTWHRESAPRVGDRVQLGVGAAVLGPVTVGDDAKIGPGAIVFFDVPEGASVVVPKPRVILRQEQAPALGQHTEGGK